MGLGTPRETIRLERHGDGVRFVMPKSGTDHTEAMRSYAARRVAELEKQDLSGYVLKKDSPSCGMERVRIYDRGGVPARTGRGLFAEALIERFPELPVEEEGRLGDARLRENFVERVFAYRRLRSFFRPRWTVGGLVAFHTAHKLLLMAHSPEAYRSLGRVVASAKAADREALRARYSSAFMKAMGVIATPGRHANVLHHMLGHFSDALDAAERAEVLGLIEDHRKGLVPLVVPLTLVRHHARRLKVSYLLGQAYLDPHPKELMLRNHV
jgi:uncharacterized protein YbgA (DUF1722 family)